MTLIHSLETTLTALKPQPLDPLQLAEAQTISQHYHPPLNPDYPALITGLMGINMAQQLQQTLLNSYRPDLPITLVRPDLTTESWSLATLAAYPHIDEATSLYLPPDPENSSFVTFQNTIAHLLSPVGCPWDREQTHQTLRPYLVEESYEVLETIDANDMPALAEELGDLLLQIALHTQIATRDNEFSWGDVIGHIQRKMIRRHPHVFGEVQVSGAGEVVTNWEVIKKAEKVQKGQTLPNPSALDGIPKGLPALAEAAQISKKASRVGFEWNNMQDLLAKIVEEAHEVAEATDLTHIESEIGDLLLMITNLARWRNVDPESALRSTNARFSRRFQYLEQAAQSQNCTLADMSAEEIDIAVPKLYPSRHVS